MFNLVWS